MHQPVPPDPFGSPGSYINASVNRLGTPLSDAEIQSQAQGMLSPLVQQITGELGRQAQAGTAAIGGYTSNLAKALSGYRQSAADIYGSAQQSQAASDAALSSRLQGGGEQMAADLSGKLASINAPNAVGQAAAGIQQTGTGSGNALYANGSAALADLIARGAAEQSYAAKLPGLAGLAGEQQLGGLQGNLQSSLADQLAQVQTQVPGIVNSLQGQRADLLNRQETLRSNLKSDQASAAAKKQALAQEARVFGLQAAKAKVGAQQGQQRIAISEQNAQTSAQNAQTSRARLKQTQANADRSYNLAVAKLQKSAQQKANSSLSKSLGYVVDSAGEPIRRNGKRIPIPKSAKDVGKGKRHGLTEGTYQSHSAEALGAARLYHAPKDKGGATWQQYLTAGAQKGIPAWILIEQGRRVYSARERKLNTYAGGG